MLLLVRLIAADEWDEMNADAREASMPIMRIRKNTERMWGGSNHATTQACMCTSTSAKNAIDEQQYATGRMSQSRSQ